MATGNNLLRLNPHMVEFPSSNEGGLDTRNNRYVVDLAVGESVYFPILIPAHYSGGGINVKCHYAMSSAITNDVRLDTTFERIGIEQQDIDSDGFDATGVDGTDTAVPGVCGHVAVLTNAHGDGARIDNLEAGETGRLKITRTAVAGTDAAGDLELTWVDLTEV